MIGIDGCVEGSFGDWDMVCVALYWRICQRLALHWQICYGLADLTRVGIGLADVIWIVRLVLD